MKITKRVLARLDSVYAVCTMELAGKLHFLAATEAKGKCLLFSPPDWSASVVWDGPGGTMSLVPAPGSGGFLAIQEFFPIFRSENAKIVHAEPGNSPAEPWNVHRVADLPFVHRIEVVCADGISYLVAASLCGGKAYQDDWSKPGAVYVARIPDSIENEWSFRPILSGISKNHGMCTASVEGRDVILIGGSEGLFMLRVPDDPDKSWQCERLLEGEVSDICVGDVDADGTQDIVTIEPFHGDALVMYRKSSLGWQRELELPISFGHTLWCGMLAGQSRIVVGSRGGDKALALVTVRSDGRLSTDCLIIDEGVGSTQVAVAYLDGRDLIISANHGAGEVALYEIAG